MPELKVTYTLTAPDKVPASELAVIDLSIGFHDNNLTLAQDEQVGVVPLTFKSNKPFSIFVVNQFCMVTAILKCPLGFAWTLKIEVETLAGQKFSPPAITITANDRGIGIHNQFILWRV